MSEQTVAQELGWLRRALKAIGRTSRVSVIFVIDQLACQVMEEDGVARFYTANCYIEKRKP